MSVFSSFPGHAHRGIKKIFAANILTLGMIALLLLVLVESLTGGYFAARTLNLLGVIVLILSLTILVLELVGVCQAIYDEPSFAKARNMLLLTLGLSLLDIVMDSVVLDLAGDVTSLLTSLFIIKSIMRLAGILKNWSVQRLGQRLYWLVLILNGGSLCLSVLDNLIQSRGSGFDRVLVLILALAVLVLSIVATVMYTMYLHQAVKMTSVPAWQQPQEAEHGAIDN
jgi:hypothetical protein